MAIVGKSKRSPIADPPIDRIGLDRKSGLAEQRRPSAAYDRPRSPAASVRRALAPRSPWRIRHFPRCCATAAPSSIAPWRRRDFRTPRARVVGFLRRVVGNQLALPPVKTMRALRISTRQRRRRDHTVDASREYRHAVRGRQIRDRSVRRAPRCRRARPRRHPTAEIAAPADKATDFRAAKIRRSPERDRSRSAACGRAAQTGEQQDQPGEADADQEICRQQHDADGFGERKRTTWIPLECSQTSYAGLTRVSIIFAEKPFEEDGWPGQARP